MFSPSQSTPNLAGAWGTHNISVQRGDRSVTQLASSCYGHSVESNSPKDSSQELKFSPHRLSRVLARGNTFARETNTTKSRTA